MARHLQRLRQSRIPTLRSLIANASIVKATALMQQLAADPPTSSQSSTPSKISAPLVPPRRVPPSGSSRGFGFENSITRSLLSTPTNKGTHGYNPAIRKMHPSFILAGITPCKSLPNVKSST